MLLKPLNSIVIVGAPINFHFDYVSSWQVWYKVENLYLWSHLTHIHNICLLYEKKHLKIWSWYHTVVKLLTKMCRYTYMMYILTKFHIYALIWLIFKICGYVDMRNLLSLVCTQLFAVKLYIYKYVQIMQKIFRS